MKKTYNCPATEVITINAAQSMMTASNPWNDNGIIQAGDENENPMF